MPFRKLDFCIVGGMKCGTSSLRDYLGSLEEVCITPSEGNFFSKENPSSSSLEDAFSTCPKAKNQHAIFGEKTVEYSLNPEALKALYTHNPEVKIIWVWRAPVKRCYSNYLHQFKQGKEKRSFGQIISDFENEPYLPFQYNYIRNGQYARQKEMLESIFPLKSIKIILFEEFKDNTLEVLKEIHNFLGLKEEVKQERYKISNATVLPRFVFMSKLIGTKFVPRYLRKTFAFLNYQNKLAGYDSPEASEEQLLRELYNEEYELVKKLFPSRYRIWGDE